MQDQVEFTITPNLTIEVHSAEDLELLDVQHVHNKIVRGGRKVLRDLWLNIGPSPQFIGVGTGSTPAADVDAGLVAEVYRNFITRKFRSDFEDKATFKLLLTSADANGFTLQEVGLFADAVFSGTSPIASGTLCARAIYTPIIKTNAITVTYTWEFVVTSP